MKTILVILVNVLIVSFIGCTNNRKAQQADLDDNLFSYADINKNNGYDSIFSEPMKQAINEFVDYIKNLKYSSSIEKKVLAFYFYSEKGKDYFTMSAESYYHKEYVEGYTYIGKYIFVFYGDEDVGSKYIDTRKLIPYQDTLPGFRSFDDVPEGYYEPFGTIFRIINPDSLILIRKGML